MSIDLSQVSNKTGNTSGSKRPNLFNEKSTSRERILTRKAMRGSNQGLTTSSANSMNTPSFNITPQQKSKLTIQQQQKQQHNINTSSEGLVEETKNNEVLKDFPFLQAQQMNSQPFEYKKLVSTGMNDELIEELKDEAGLYTHQEQHFNQNDVDTYNDLYQGQRQVFSSSLAGYDNKQSSQKFPGVEFFDGIDAISQSEVSHTPRTNTMRKRTDYYYDDQSSINDMSQISHSIVNSNQKNDKKVIQQLDIKHNLQIASQKQLHEYRNLQSEVNLRRITGQPVKITQDNQKKKEFYWDISDLVRHNRKKEEEDIQVMNLNTDSLSNQDEFFSAKQDDTLNFDQHGQKDNFNVSTQQQIPDLQISQIDHRPENFQISQDDLLGGMTLFNRKEERLKTQITQYILDKILYDQVIPNKLRDLAKTTILNYSSLNQSNQTQLKQLSEQIYNDNLLKTTLIKFLNDFFTVTDDSYESQKALKRYLDEVLIENVNFTLCSEIWNDCLLLPHIVKEDPNIFLNNMICQILHEVVQETLDEELKHETQQSHKLAIDNESTEQIKISNNQFSQDFEILKYVEDNLVMDFVYDEVEELVIEVMQQIYFMNKKMPQIIAEEIYNDMIRGEIRSNAQQVAKKERILNKGADNYLQMFMSEEIADLIEESILSLTVKPMDVAEDAVSKTLDLVSQQLIEQHLQIHSFNLASQSYVDTLINSQLERLLISLTQQCLSNTNSETKIMNKIGDAIIQEVVFDQLSQVITHSIQQEKDLEFVNHDIVERFMENEVHQIIDECVNEEVAQDEFDGLIDKIVEMDIWRETVKELKWEEEAIFALIEDWTDNYTGEFFIDHFSEIKDEYLRNYKEQMTKLENSQIKEMSVLNISTQQQNPFIDTSMAALNRSSGFNNDELMSNVNSSRFHDCLSSLQNTSKLSIKHLNFSRRQSNNTSSHVMNNTSQFHSVNSEAFYDCHDNDGNGNGQNPPIILDDHEFQMIQQKTHEQEQTKLQNTESFQVQQQQQPNELQVIHQDEKEEDFTEQSQFHTFSNDRKNPIFDTLHSEVLDETMQYMEIEEGVKAQQTLQNYYIIPEIKSLDFLNIQQNQFSKYFKQNHNQSKPQTLMLPVDALAIDVLCVNCYECVKYDQVDDHSNYCLKNQQQKLQQQTPVKSKTVHRRKSHNDYPEDLAALLSGRYDEIEGSLNQATKYNFEEGRYIIEQPHDDEKEAKIKEEREYIAELNERIFKLHKAIKEKQIEEQSSLSLNTGANDMTLLRHLDDIEALALNIFTNNTNKKELEIHGSELIDKIKEFKPVNAKELSLSITARRLSQLTLEKIQSLAVYQHLVGTSDPEMEEIFSSVGLPETLNNVSYQNIHDEKEDFSEYLPRSLSQTPNTKNKHRYASPQTPLNNNQTSQQVSEDQFRYLEEEQKQQKAELEIWRNLHNQILRDYLMTKAPVIAAGNRQLHEISSDVSSTRNGQEHISDNTSTYSSNTGVSSFNGSQFYTQQATPRQQHQRMSSGHILSPTNAQNTQATENIISDVGHMPDVEDSLRYKESEDLKRHFYTMAIHNSKRILKSIPQGSVLKSLYKKCMELNVQVSDWETFIQSELRDIKRN